MKQDENYKKLEYLKGKLSLQKVAGWKIFIFLPHSVAWRCLVIVMVIIGAFVDFTECFYLINTRILDLLHIFCDAGYFVDVILATLHFFMGKTRKLKFGEKRHPVLLIIDYVSLVPFDLMYEYMVFEVEGSRMTKHEIRNYLSIISSLRLYQIPKSFSYVKKFIYGGKANVVVVFFEIISYFVLFAHFSGCLIFLYFEKKQKDDCLKHIYLCVAETVMEAFHLITAHYITPLKNYPVQDYRLLLIGDFFFGYLFIYGYVLPLFLFTYCKYLNDYFDYSTKWAQIRVLTRNRIKEKSMEKKIMKYFNYSWIYGRSNLQEELLEHCPLSLKKNVLTDLYWEAIRHSFLLQDLSMGCKRSIALCMKTEFVLPETVLFVKNQVGTYFLYIKSGILQVMAEENSNMPVLSLSKGTVLGELSFFLHVESKATVRTGKLSVLHILKFKDLLRVLLDYPNDVKKIISKVKFRLKLAKSKHKIKIAIGKQFSSDEAAKKGNIVWLKRQYRAIFELHKAENLAKKYCDPYSKEEYHRALKNLNTQLEFTSMHISMININDEKLHKQEIVCYKTSFPWLINPQCNFIFLWKVMISIVTMYAIVAYPSCIGCFFTVPRWFFNFSIVVTVLYVIDVLLQFFTAIKAKDVMIKRFFAIVFNRLTSVSFYADIVAAIPFQIIFHITQDLNDQRFQNLCFINALIKAYILFPALNKWNYNPTPGAFFRTLQKYIFLMLVLIYWSAAIFYLTGVKCFFYNCEDRDWYQILVRKYGKIDPILACFFRAVYLSFDTPSETLETKLFLSFFIFWIIFAAFVFFSYSLMGECIACYVLGNTYSLEYARLKKFTHRFMKANRITGRTLDRVMEMMDFKWHYDRGESLTEKTKIMDIFSEQFKKEVNQQSLLPVLARCELFKKEDEKFLWEISRTAELAAYPMNAVLVTFGSQGKRLCLIERGFVQLNSFIRGDLNMNISKPITAKPGCIFPIIDILLQIPSAVSAVTTTDCEAVILNLEDVLSAMMIHGMFKDVVETLQQTNLSALTTAKLGLSMIKNETTLNHNFYEVFDRYKYFGKVLKHFFIKRAIDSHSIWYAYWELICVLSKILYLIAWPIVFGCYIKSERLEFLVKFLTFFDFLPWFDFYFKMNVAYYNHLGIYVTHTCATTLHYLTTTFMTDLIAFAPNFYLFYIIANNKYVFDVYVVSVLTLMRSLSLYRVYGFVKFVDSFKISLINVNIILIIISLALILHYYLCMKVYLILNGYLGPSIYLIVDEKIKLTEPYEFYFSELSLLIGLILKSEIYNDKFDLYTLIYYSIIFIVGMMGKIWMLSLLSLNHIASNKKFITHQYYLRSFKKYLRRLNTQVDIKNLAIAHFENEWNQEHGYNAQKVFSTFPQILHEDILLPIFKKTLTGVQSLSGANESFYRSLIKNITELHLNEKYLITFPKQVQSDIFFIHSGKCLIEESNQVLCKGALIGNIKGNRIMKTTIRTKTKVKLLQIPSKVFLEIISTFYNTKMAYELETAEAEDFIKSIYCGEEHMKSDIFILEEEAWESKFIPDDQAPEIFRKKKKKKWRVHSESVLARCICFVFLFVAFFTVIIIPIVMGTRFVPVPMLVIIYTLDVLWVLKIIVHSLMFHMDEKKIFTKRKNFKLLILTLKIFLQVLSIVPIEVIPLLYFGASKYDEYCYIMTLCYVNRLLRVYYFFYYFGKRRQKKRFEHFYMKVVGIVMLIIVSINVFCILFLSLERKDVFNFYKCYKSLTFKQTQVLLWGYLCVLNAFVGGGMYICLSDTFKEVAFRLFIMLYAFVISAYFTNHMLMIIYVTHDTKSKQLQKLKQLEKFLTVHDVSPALVKRSQRYFLNLVNSFHERAEPCFLKTAPPYIRGMIMQNLYISHVANCFAFANLEEAFINQLTSRLEPCIFFPEDYITEKGDVDHNMYFIHTGEVYCIEADKDYSALEAVEDLYVAGESFGVLQGVLFSFPQSHTFRAKTFCDVLVLNYHRWEDLRLAFPKASESIYKKCLQSLN